MRHLIRSSSVFRAAVSLSALSALLVIAALSTGCAEKKPEPQILLSKGRVKVEVKWRNHYNNQSGTGLGVAQNDAIGSFYFTEPSSTEVFVKVLDFGPDKPYLLFYGGLTDFEYTVIFTNVATGKSVSLKKDAGKFEGGTNTNDLAH